MLAQSPLQSAERNLVAISNLHDINLKWQSQSHLQVEGHQATLSQHVNSHNGSWSKRLGLCLGGLMLISVSALAVLPLASHSRSPEPAERSHHVAANAFIPALLDPTGLRSSKESQGLDSAVPKAQHLFNPSLRRSVQLANQLARTRASFQNTHMQAVNQPEGAKVPVLATKARAIAFTRRAYLAGLGVAAATLTGAAGTAQAADVVKDAGTTVISDSNSQKLAIIEDATAEMFEKVAPSVVNIFTEYTPSSVGLGNLAQQGLQNQSKFGMGQGTGFVWDKKGHIVTNFHVINKVQSTSVSVTQPDGTQKKYDAKLTGVDPDTDIAVLKIDAPESVLQVLKVGDSTAVRVGQFAFAFGDPFGLDLSLSVGVISGKNREMPSPTGRRILGVLQTDADVNPGNSGGPLLDSKGRIIGINTATVGGTGVSAGVGFAVPMNLARPSIEQLIEFGEVQRAVLGISYLAGRPADAARTGLPVVEKGIIVMEVPKNSPGEAAGMIAVKKPEDPNAKGAQPILGDVIIGINNDQIGDAKDLATVLNKYKPGDTVDIQVLRGVDKEPKTLKLKFGSFRSASFSNMQNERANLAGEAPKYSLNKP